MQLTPRQAVAHLLPKLGLKLSRPLDPDDDQNTWVVLDPDGEVWTGPFECKSDFTHWFLEHAAYAITERRMFDRFQKFYVSASEAEKAQLRDDVIRYQLGESPRLLNKAIHGRDVSWDNLPPDWTEQFTLALGPDLAVQSFEKLARCYLKV